VRTWSASKHSRYYGKEYCSDLHEGEAAVSALLRDHGHGLKDLEPMGVKRVLERTTWILDPQCSTTNTLGLQLTMDEIDCREKGVILPKELWGRLKAVKRLQPSESLVSMSDEEKETVAAGIGT
jgi:hypothetical protein